MAQEENRQKFFLPEDVITDIRSRLPVKTLLRLKCVCNKWRTLISSPYFTSMHLDRSNSNPLRQSILVRVFSPEAPRTRFVPFDPLTFSPSTYLNDELDQVLYCTRYTEFLGSINGLLCLRGYFGQSVYLWNPSTRMLRKIEIDTDKFYSIGFGFDPIANDYKLVGFNIRNENGVARMGLMVWSTNLDSSREINVDSNITGLRPICDVMVKEFAYWISNQGSASRVASFNMSTEVLQVVPVPDAYPMDNPAYHGVIWKGDFAMAASDRSRTYQV